MAQTDFYVDYETGTPAFTDELKAEVETFLVDLAAGNTDLTGAAVSVTPAAKNDDAQPIRYRARIVVYTRPENINASKEDDSIQGALKAAMAAVERQVREKRDKLGKPWEREDLKDQVRPAEDVPEEVLEDLARLADDLNGESR